MTGEPPLPYSPTIYPSPPPNTRLKLGLLEKGNLRELFPELTPALNPPALNGQQPTSSPNLTKSE